MTNGQLSESGPGAKAGAEPAGRKSAFRRTAPREESRRGHVRTIDKVAGEAIAAGVPRRVRIKYAGVYYRGVIRGDQGRMFRIVGTGAYSGEARAMAQLALR